MFHFDLSNYLRMLRLAWRERNPRARRSSLRILLLTVPPVASFHALCFALDRILFPGLWRTEVRSPVFVLGHARSGTTLLHRLMSRDEGRFSSFVLYELYFPSLLQKKVIRAMARLDKRAFGGFLERRVRAWEGARYAAVRKVHPMGLSIPEEDDMVLYYSCASGFWITKLPYMGELDFFYVDQLPDRKRRRVMRFYKECVRRQLYLNGDDRTHLSKNPVFCGRVESLIETFPDARFAVLLRNPYETIPSLLKLMSGSWRRLDWDAAQVSRCLEILAEQSFDTYRYPLEVLERHPAVPRALVHYRDLVTDPAATIERIYEELGFELAPAYREVMREESARAKGYRSDHRYALEEFGLEKDAIRLRLADLFDRFGWDRGPAPAAPGEGGA